MATAAEGEKSTTTTKRSSSGKGFKLSLPLLWSIHVNKQKPESPSPASPATGRSKEAELLRVFRHFDINRDGRISGEELGSYFASTTGEAMSKEDAEKVIGDFDKDGDGKLEFGEFVRMVDGGGGEGIDDKMILAAGGIDYT